MVWRVFGSMLALMMTCAVIGIIGVFLIFHYYSRDLPDYAQLKDYQPEVVTRLYAADGRLLAEYATEKRTFVPITAIPKRLVNAFLSAEDKNFYTHPGIDFIGLGRAILTNAKNMGQGGLVGGSTITQQVVKNFLLTNEKSMERKVKEAILAFRINKALSKDKILELYLNKIYLGSGSYGVAAAALDYFNKSIDELSIEEAALLAALPKAPSRYSPHVRPEDALVRRNWVIDRMLEDGHITPEENKTAKAMPIVTRTRDEAEVAKADFFAEEVRRDLVKRYGGDALYKGGLVVRTTLDPVLQEYARAALHNGILAYDRKHGWRGPLAKTATTENWKETLEQTVHPDALGSWHLAMVLKVTDAKAEIGLENGGHGVIPLEELKWARPTLAQQTLGPAVTKAKDVLAVGDIVAVERLDENENAYGLRQIPAVSGSIVVIEPHTGRVLATVGGYNFGDTEFNRATQAKRQPGSAFKTFVYTAALEAGFTPSSIILDAPVELYQGAGLPVWRPKNYSDDFLGPTTLRRGLEKSRNAMTVRLAQQLGINRLMEIGQRLGIYDELPRNYSIALGSMETTLMRLTAAYAMLVNGGKRVSPSFIERIQDRNGATIYRRDDRACEGCLISSITEASNTLPPRIPDTRPSVTDPQTAYQMVSMLEGVVQRGTAVRAKVLNRPLAGKTGTTNDSNDAWFIGFSPDLVAGVYMGFDRPSTLGKKETGASVALPIFIEFMGNALKDTPPTPFRTPPGIRLARVNAATGQSPMPGTPEKDVILEAFRSDTAPPAYQPVLTRPATDEQPAASGEPGMQPAPDPMAAQQFMVPEPVSANPPHAPFRPSDEKTPTGTGGLY